MRIVYRGCLLLSAAVVVACAGSIARSDKPTLVPNPHFAKATGEYGYTETNPVLVASLGGSNRAENEHIFLGRLRTPDGRPVRYERRGSCCGFPTPNPHYGNVGLLDKYAVFIDPNPEPIILYLNMYDPGEVRAPAGFILAD